MNISVQVRECDEPKENVDFMCFPVREYNICTVQFDEKQRGGGMTRKCDARNKQGWVVDRL